LNAGNAGETDVDNRRVAVGDRRRNRRYRLIAGRAYQDTVTARRQLRIVLAAGPGGAVKVSIHTNVCALDRRESRAVCYVHLQSALRGRHASWIHFESSYPRVPFSGDARLIVQVILVGVPEGTVIGWIEIRGTVVAPTRGGICLNESARLHRGFTLEQSAGGIAGQTPCIAHAGKDHRARNTETHRQIALMIHCG
jgi:hypothetical protein